MTQQLDLLGMMLDEASTRRLALPAAREVRRPRMQPLVDVPRAANADPDTSHLAAADVKSSGRMKAQQERCRAAVYAHPGKTSAELARIEAGRDDVKYRVLRQAYGRRLPEWRDVPSGIRQGESRRCDETKRECVTWWPTACGQGSS